ncbi:MAG: type II toxin-antitoxin system VapC family toxin [Propylenella sp.]
MSVVLDASMTIAWLFAAERTEGSRAALRRVAAEGAAVPSIWRLEVANVLRGAVRSGRCTEDYADRSLGRLARLQIEVDPETEQHAWGETRRLAQRHDLTLYDASYLELALRFGQPLASCDRPLAKAAKGAGLEVLGG